jgi:hypothetical protein
MSSTPSVMALPLPHSIESMVTDLGRHRTTPVARIARDGQPPRWGGGSMTG